jgi:hypothetical protein
VGFGSGTRELTRKTEEWDVGTHAVLVRVKDRSLGFACGLSTAAVRWRPTGVRGGRGTREAGQRGGKKRSRAWRRRRVEGEEAGGG